jgi:hypothetical protein
MKSLIAALFSFALVPCFTSAFAGVIITSPRANATVYGSVPISASAIEGKPFHLELWDNGHKLGDVFSNSVNIAPVMPKGFHTLTIFAVTSTGKVLDRSVVPYVVASGTPKISPTPPAPAPPPPVSSSPASGVVDITSPAPGSTSISAVSISAAANLSTPVHLAIWDNGTKLGDVPAATVDGVYVLPNGLHVLTVQAVDKNGSIVTSSSVNYNVAEKCTNSRYAQCDLDQLQVNNVQNDCNPMQQLMWVANGCGDGVQGVNPTDPTSTLVASISEGGPLLNQGNLTLNGHSLHVGETQIAAPSNVLFRGQSPSTTPTGAIDSHWMLDEYVYLPDPSAHQAFEMDAQYTAGGLWTKFYTECAFNMNSGTGYWAVFNSSTGGWIFLNGQAQGGQTPPVVPCNRNQFSQPWAGSSNPSFSGWHHIAWSFTRNSDGTVTFETLTFDATTTVVGFHPNSASGGQVSDSGNFSALIQLDGIVNSDRTHDLVDAYVSEISLTHMP